jgi:hypothetical protein
MRSILGSSVASLAVLYVLFALLSEHREIPSGSGLISNTERIADVGDRLIQVIVLRHQRQSKDFPANPNADWPMKVQQQALDSAMRQSTRETIRSFKESIVTGTVDDHTGPRDFDQNEREVSEVLARVGNSY